MAPRTTYANLADGLQPFSLFDQSLADMGSLGVIPCTAAGTNAIVLTQMPSSFAPTITAYQNNVAVSFVPAATSTGSVTLQLGALPAVPVYLSTGIQAAANDVVLNTMVIAAYNAVLSGFMIISANTRSSTVLGPGTVNVKEYANIAAAYAALPSTGGTVLIPNGYTETLTSDLTLNKAYCGLLCLGTATITTGTNHIFMGTSVNGVFIRGLGAYQSDISGVGTVGFNIISSVTTGAAISIGASGQRTNFHALANVVVDMRAASAGTFGVQLTRTVFWTLDHISIAGGNQNATGLEIDGTATDFGGFGEIIKPQIRNFQKGIVTTGAANAIQMYGGLVDCNNIASSVGLTRDGTLAATAGFIITGTEISTCITGISQISVVKGDRYTVYTENNTTDISAGASTLNNTAEFILPFTKSDSGTSNNFVRTGFNTLNLATGVTGILALVNGGTGSAAFTSMVGQISNSNLIGGSNAGAALTSSTNNILVGFNAGKAITSGTGENVIIGTTAGQSMTTGTQNTIVGAEAGAAITGDTGHTLVGYQSGTSLNGNAQTWNTFVGHAAGILATGAGGCIAIGRAAGRGLLNDADCVAVGHAAFYYNNGGSCAQVSAFGNQAAGAPVDGTGTNWQGSGQTYWGAINDTGVLYVGDSSGKSSAAARTNASAIGHLARLPLRDNVVVLGHGIAAVETVGSYWDGWNRATDISSSVGVTITAAQLLSGLILHGGALSGGISDTTDTAANIVAVGPGANCEVPASIERSIGNNTSGGFNITLVGGAGVSISSLGLGAVIAPGVLAKFRFVVTVSTPGSEAVTLFRVG